jgi:DNA-binding transcriptional MerR regulator
MRQLDLFGSIIETPVPEKVPAPKPPVSESTGKVFEVSRAVERPSSQIETVEELRKTDEAADETGRIDSMDEDGVLPGSSDYPAIFDAPIIVIEEAETATNETSFIETDADEDDIQLLNKLRGAITEDDAQVVVPENTLLPTVEEEKNGSLVATIYENKPATEKLFKTRQKMEGTVQASGTSSIVFDDGRIAVKIKNKPAIETELIKGKKEKVPKILQKRGRKSFKEIEAEVDLIDIPEDEVLFQKQYYTISEVAKWFRVNTSLLRFWENEFDVLKPKKNRKGDRLFRPEDVKNIQLIYQLLRQRKYTIEGAKEYIKTNGKKADIQNQLISTLQKFKSFLLDLKANLQ